MILQFLPAAVALHGDTENHLFLNIWTFLILGAFALWYYTTNGVANAVRRSIIASFAGKARIKSVQISAWQRRAVLRTIELGPRAGLRIAIDELNAPLSVAQLAADPIRLEQLTLKGVRATATADENSIEPRSTPPGDGPGRQIIIQEVRVSGLEIHPAPARLADRPESGADDALELRFGPLEGSLEEIVAAVYGRLRHEAGASALSRPHPPSSTPHP